MADIDFEEVQLGTAPTGVGGDVPRTAFGKITRNFNKIKAFLTDPSSAASRKVGTESGDVMEVGAFGLGNDGSARRTRPTDIRNVTHSGMYQLAVSSGEDYPTSGSSTLLQLNWEGNTEIKTQIVHGLNNRVFVSAHGTVGWSPYQELIHTGNTTTDSNGFIKAASPIIKLSNDKIEKTDHLEIENAEFERIGTGHYKLKNVPLLSRDGWYIETPKDRNNNIYFTLDYEENNGELIIKTYEPDYSSGRAENGAPVDILEGRFVSLRFAENPELYPEPEDE